MKKSILLFGGPSEERLVSLASAQTLCARFEFSQLWFWHKNGSVFEVTTDELLDHKDSFTDEFEPKTKAVANSLESLLPSLAESTVFLGLHGTLGEDGALQALFEKHQIAFTGSGSKASHQAFEKDLAKSIVQKAGVAVAPELLVSQNTTETELKAFFHLHKKIVLKPLANGSSIGLHVIHDEAELLKVGPEIRSGKNGNYLAEKFIAGRELTVGVLETDSGLMALPPSEVVMASGRSFDYRGKYLGDGSQEHTPASISAIETESAQAIAVAAHKALGCRGYSRTDMMLTETGIVFIETNTLPGLSKASFIPQQLAVKEISMEVFIRGQLDIAQKKLKEKSQQSVTSK